MASPEEISPPDSERSSASLQLRLLIDKYSILRLDPASTSLAFLTTLISASASSASPHSALCNLSISPHEISLVLPTSAVCDHSGQFLRHGDLQPQAVESGWLAFRVEPPRTGGGGSPEDVDESKSKELPPGIDFSVVGIMARLSGLLARAQVSLFAISTFDTDYILVKEEKITVAVRALRMDGCGVQLEDPESEMWSNLGLSNKGPFGLVVWFRDMENES